MSLIHPMTQHPPAIRELGLDKERVSVKIKLLRNGVAIALDHPLDYTGAKLTVQALQELARQSKELALVTMRVGAAGVVEPVN